jgi:hypothetical protein
VSVKQVSTEATKVRCFTKLHRPSMRPRVRKKCGEESRQEVRPCAAGGRREEGRGRRETNETVRGGDQSWQKHQYRSSPDAAMAPPRCPTPHATPPHPQLDLPLLAPHARLQQHDGALSLSLSALPTWFCVGVCSSGAHSRAVFLTRVSSVPGPLPQQGARASGW